MSLYGGFGLFVFVVAVDKLERYINIFAREKHVG